MKMLCIALVFLMAASASAEKRIVNGSPAALFSHPYIASVQVSTTSGWVHNCGGILIAKDKVLTAAHCLQNGITAKHLRVEVGAMNLYEDPNQYEQTVAVSSFSNHAGYYKTNYGVYDDIAVITLSKAVTLNDNVKVAELAPAGSSFVDTKCVISGWGQTVGGPGGASAMTLKEVAITKIDNAICKLTWREVTDKHICVYEHEGASGSRPSSCNGDSGGPMMCGDSLQYLAGVTSYGDEYCTGDTPSVYTRVSEYIDWIRERM